MISRGRSDGGPIGPPWPPAPGPVDPPAPVVRPTAPVPVEAAWPLAPPPLLAALPLAAVPAPPPAAPAPLSSVVPGRAPTQPATASVSAAIVIRTRVLVRLAAPFPSPAGLRPSASPRCAGRGADPSAPHFIKMQRHRNTAGRAGARVTN